MKELRTDLNLETYIQLVEAMKNQGYQLYGLFIQEELVSLVGFEERLNLYLGKHIFIYDLVTSVKHRSKGFGEVLLEFVHHYATAQGASHVALESGLSRTDTHRFYTDKMDYSITSYSFRKRLLKNSIPRTITNMELTRCTENI